jgi:anti-sigma-K factor RskA
MTGPDEDAVEVLAAELAIGLLAADERRAAEARRVGDPAFDAACRRWEDWVSGLLEGHDVAPSAALWDRIHARLPANDDRQLAGLRRSVGRWRGAAAGLAVIAAMLGGALARERRFPRPAPAPVVAPAPAPTPIVVILTSADRRAIVSVSFDRASGRFVAATDAFRPGRRSAELWVIPADQVPRSLGLLFEPDTDRRLTPGEASHHLVPGVTLAISLEPLGGSKSGKPTGPVVLTGKV